MMLIKDASEFARILYMGAIEITLWKSLIILRAVVVNIRERNNEKSV